MKRLIVLFLVFLLTASLVACGESSSDQSTESQEPEPVAEQTEEQTEAADESQNNEEDLAEDAVSDEVGKDDGANQGETGLGEAESETEDITSTIPVMLGSSLEKAEAVMKTYNVYKSFDTDFGHGTIDRSYVNDDWSLMVDIIYLDETKEILYGDIVTSPLSSKDLQVAFIKNMAKVLCPDLSSEDVSKWVDENVGKEIDTTIDGFSYELSFNPEKHNLIYDAGRINWEEWEYGF